MADGGLFQGNVDLFEGLDDIVNLEVGGGNTSSVIRTNVAPPSATPTPTIPPENVVTHPSPLTTQTGRFEFGNTSVPQPPLGNLSVAHLPVSAAQTVQRGRRLRTRMPISVATKGRQRSFKFCVDPDGDVSCLRALLVNRLDNLPLDYGFTFNRDFLREDISFRSQGIVAGAKIEVVNFSVNFQPRNV